MISDDGIFGTVWELLDFQNGRHKMAQMAKPNTMICRCDHLC